MTYHHLSREERYQISALLKEGLNQSEIALNLGRHKTTISREIARNSGLRGYRPKQASFLVEQRSICSRNDRQIHPSDWLLVKRYLQSQWSPEQISAEVCRSATRRFTAISMRINLSAARFTATLAVRKSGENDMLAAERDVDK